VDGLLEHPMDRQGQDFLDLVSSQHQGLPAARQVLQTVEAFSIWRVHHLNTVGVMICTYLQIAMDVPPLIEQQQDLRSLG